jgi:hypothetical protein
MKNDRPRMNNKATLYILSVALVAMLNSIAVNTTHADKPKDTHYNDVGFFDIHVCNWPNRKLFFMPLFSTTRYDEVQKIDVMDPDGQPLVQLDLTRYRVIKQENKKEKHAFMNQLDVPTAAKDGWYTAQITLSNGSVHTASDYVNISTLDKARGHRPGHNEETESPPGELRWDPVPGAGFYQVFIRDQWNDDQLIHSSGLLTEPVLTLPPGLVKSGGMYSWIVHSRDVNEDLLLGDFNHGSLSKPMVFSVSD